MREDIIYQQLFVKLTKLYIMNKKTIFGSIAVLVIAAMAAFNVNVNSQEKGLSDVSLANVEALANETPDWWGGYTTGSKSFTRPDGSEFTIPCCVPSVETNACDYNRTGCITNESS